MRGADHRQQTLASFDWQWAHLPTGDFMPGDRWFDTNAAHVLARELCAITPAWFRGKRVLDAGCGLGRWSRTLLELGADVTAIDFSEAGLARTREVCEEHPRLRTRHVNLLDIPNDVASDRFDLVFSFGVLHHTGDTWRALENVARLVDKGGALFLYLYGTTSWEAAERERIERTRQELASLGFEEKIAELRRRYPGQDPHQLFDLLSPVINDRVTFHEVAERIRGRGFDRVVQTIAGGEVYLLATRSSFPASDLLAPVGSDSEFTREAKKRWLRRSGAAFEASLRTELAAIRSRPAPAAAVDLLRLLPTDAHVLDVSLPADRIMARPDVGDGEPTSPATPGALANAKADVVISLGASLGACRYPTDYLLDLWTVVSLGGTLLIEVPVPSSMRTRRTIVDRLLDARHPVPKKVARLLARRPQWCTGHALFAIGGESLLNPLDAENVSKLLRDAGATSVDTYPARPGTTLLMARSGT